MFRKILIANRGEIAVRIIRACRDLGVSPVAVYSDADATALHVRLVDEAYHIGAPPSAESYLRIDRLLDVARRSGAEAVHPGYGFLAERAEFARSVRDAGLIFIGPAAEAIEAMGSKTNARRAAIAAGAPVVPGTIEPLASADEARDVAAQFGYPVMLKATAGGGGKGMRLVAADPDITSAFETAQAEAIAAFGDGSIYIEKAIERPRHVEIQIIADNHGGVVHLGERECSIQRRHQKVIEEAPSPLDDVGLRARMGAASVLVARSVGYIGAGTIEYLVSDVTREFYFLEMNTRLQVEHPVTEMVTNIDIVREQITIAAGAKLSFTQDDIVMRGHAIECRVYAEDPENDFLPSPGKITHLRAPAGPNVRDDSGVESGDEISIYYDPMISKLAVWGRTRDEAIERLRRALDEYTVGGIRTTLPFFRRVVNDPEFRSGRLDTGFIERFRERDARTADERDDEPARLAALVAALAYQDEQQFRSTAHADHAGASADSSRDAWRLAGRAALHRGRA